MAYSNNCTYSTLTVKPCRICPNHIPDIDGCSLNKSAIQMSTELKAKTYEERLRDYEKERQEYLQLSKEALVDLIIKRPDY